jgi:riboflavin biosynthesis pyrimidine reductase
MRQLLPTPGDVDLDDLVRDLDLVSRAPAARPYMVSNFALTWDGSAAIGGRAGPIGSAADLRWLLRLRAAADAVLVGAGTVRAERYGPLLPDEDLRRERREAGRSPDPLAVIPTRSGGLPWDAGLFKSGRGEVRVLGPEGLDVPRTPTPVTTRGFEAEVDLGTALAELREERDVRAVVCEGGPRLHAELIDLGLIDELFVTLAPKLAGGEGPRLVEGLPERVRALRPVWLLEHEGELFARLAVRD